MTTDTGARFAHHRADEINGSTRTTGNVVDDSNAALQPVGLAGGLYDPDTGLGHVRREAMQ